MPDYSKCVIYKITTGDDLYIGSTCNFTRRKNHHKSSIYDNKLKDYNTKLYKTIRENDGEWDIKIIKQYPCDSRIEQVTEEERCRVLLGANLNSQKCNTTKEERAEYMRLFNLNYRNGEKRNELLQSKREYYEKNKDRYRQIVSCECGCEVTQMSLLRHKKSVKHNKLMESKTQNL